MFRPWRTIVVVSGFMCFLVISSSISGREGSVMVGAVLIVPVVAIVDFTAVATVVVVVKIVTRNDGISAINININAVSI